MHNLLRVITISFLVCALRLGAADTPDETRLLRFPTTNGKQVVFSYAGQLYTADLHGGIARRLTNSPGYAIFPRFSADGKTLAFTAQYDGNTEVYAMPAEGGVPKRLTYSATLKRDDVSDRMGPNNLTMTWKNTTNEVVYRSRSITFNDFIGQLFSVGLDADVPHQLPLPQGGFISFSPDDTQVAYNRIFREFRTWKAYRGGMADEIWIHNFKTGTTEAITHNDAQDIIPMWAPNGKIYYLSDRDGRLNLFSYDTASKATVQLTHYKDFDIKFPSLGGGVIVYEQAGYIRAYDTAKGTDSAVPVTVKEDFASARPVRASAAPYIESLDLSPDGKRLAIVARGDVFTVPAKNGPVRNLTQSPGAQERDATWSPNGKWIAYISDATGEDELYLRTQDGKGDAVQITKGSSNYFFAPLWSPDSTKLLWTDRAQHLRFVDVTTKEVTEVEHSPVSQYYNYTWAPDSKWIAFVRPQSPGPGRLALYSLETKLTKLVSSPWYNASAPRFSDDGRFLLFASGRDFRATFSDVEWNYAYKNLERVYLIPLAATTPSPLAPKSDEVAAASEPAKPSETPAADKPAPAPAPVVVKIDFDGIEDRAVGLPIPAANYSQLRLLGDKLYYLRQVAGALNGGEDENSELTTNAAYYDLAERKETDLGTVTGFDLSVDGKHMLVIQEGTYAIIDTPAAKIEIKDKIALSGLETTVDYAAEWSNIYHASWRQMRDFFYAPNMHGVDWAGQRDKYASLLPYVKNRYDLTYILGELVGELHVGHSYVGGGAHPATPRVQTGLLGARVSRDAASKAYRIDHILLGENWEANTVSPLKEIGVGVKEGDFILAVNGQKTSELDNLYSALLGTVGKQVVLTVNATPSLTGARDVTVVPIADEGPLYYLEWVRANIEHVAAKTGGQVGYIHIPDMGPEGLNEFVKHFYTQLEKKALIIDDRGNGGGNVSPMIIERLRRELAMIEIDRNGVPTTDPTNMHLGPLTLLTNEYSASDGDIFPFRFRAHHLGKIIGKRTWGGVVGINEARPLLDGGFINTPASAPYAVDGSKWVVEGHGVDPDIVVDNDPTREFNGEDQQLDKAIEVILEELKTKAYTLPSPPPYPDKH